LSSEKLRNKAIAGVWIDEFVVFSFDVFGRSRSPNQIHGAINIVKIYPFLYQI